MYSGLRPTTGCSETSDVDLFVSWIASRTNARTQHGRYKSAGVDVDICLCQGFVYRTAACIGWSLSHIEWNPDRCSDFKRYAPALGAIRETVWAVVHEPS